MITIGMNRVLRRFWEKTDLEQYTHYGYVERSVEKYLGQFETQPHWFLDYLFRVVVPHKVAVYQAGVKLFTEGIDVGANRTSWIHQLMKHDFSKFSEMESAYGKHNFFDPSQNSDQQKLDFQLAWHHHKLNNPHHPEYWISVGKRGQTEFLPMPRRYVAEMVADWIGAGYTYGNSLEDWLPANLPNFYFHAQTAKILDEILTQLGFRVTEITRIRENVMALAVKNI